MATVSPALKQFIREEVTRQLRELKVQLNKEMAEDMTELHQTVSAETRTDIDRKMKAALADVKRDVAANMNNQLVAVNAANAAQLATVRADTRELVLAVGKQVQGAVYNKVVGEINAKIVPQVEGLVQATRYSLQDGAELVNEYRSAVDHDMRAREDGPGTFSANNGNVRLFFEN